MTLLLVLGVGVFALGAGLDLAYHIGLGNLGIYAGEDGHLAHWVTLAGMVLTLVGVVTTAVPRPRREHAHHRRESHAHR